MRPSDMLMVASTFLLKFIIRNKPIAYNCFSFLISKKVVWNFMISPFSYEVYCHFVRKRRNHKVPYDFLGNQEGKTVVSDRLISYDELQKKSGCDHQICWTHLLRNSKDLAEHYKEAKYIHKRMKFIYRKAKKGERKDKLLRWADKITERTYKHLEVYKFVKSVCRKHRENLFRFVGNQKVGSTNNLAE